VLLFSLVTAVVELDLEVIPAIQGRRLS
jgi:hypothetical protein